jgi:phosphoribosylaminoimidazole carboxylase (NCAIR synthetase)
MSPLVTDRLFFLPPSRKHSSAGYSGKLRVPPHRSHDRKSPLAIHLDFVGVLALQLLQVDADLLAFEFAPRMHNTGHWTIDGAETSQFENHLLGILGFRWVPQIQSIW